MMHDRPACVRPCSACGRILAMIFVFEVHIGPGHTAEQYADAWVRASEIIQQAPGARGTRLHRKIGDPNVLLAIAHWESKALRDAMEANPAGNVKAIIEEQAQFVGVRVIGEFEDPDWVVEGRSGDHPSAGAAG